MDLLLSHFTRSTLYHLLTLILRLLVICCSFFTHSAQSGYYCKHE